MIFACDRGVADRMGPIVEGGGAVAGGAPVEGSISVSAWARWDAPEVWEECVTEIHYFVCSAFLPLPTTLPSIAEHLV